ncbi:hypothetical protein GLOTRDRAFT_97380, partial [Gloeophyllum trabeum ATCC 11539]
MSVAVANDLYTIIDEHGRIITSRTNSRLLNEISLYYYEPTPRQYMETNWACEETPWQLEVIQPHVQRWDGVFRRLNLTRTSVPVVRCVGGWVFADREYWANLEEALLSLISMLGSMLLVPLRTTAPKFPRTYGYGNVWPTEAKVKSTVMYSRTAFAMVMGYIDYLLTRIYRKKPTLILSELCNRHGLNMRWLDLVTSSSFLSSPKSDRVGAIFNGQNPVSWAHEEISTCTERGYPIFVYWGSVQAFGKIDPRNVPPYLAPFLPSAGSVNAILAGQSVPSSLPECQPSPPQVHSSWSSWPVLQSSPAQSSSAQSAPAQSSTAQSAPERRYDPLGRGSYIGEGPLEFIERRKARVAERYAKATRSQVQSWNSKAQAQRDYPCPGNSSKAPTVYRWEVLDEERGLLVRRVVTRSEVPDIWFEVHDKYKWYDPTENSWDLYDAIRPDRVTVEAYDEPGVDEEYYEPTPPAGSPPTDPVPPPPPTATPPP